MSDRNRLGRWLALALPLALLGGAYLSQYGFGLYPCEMCWWQRWPHFAAAALAALGLATRHVAWSWLALGGIVISGLIGGYHAGVEYDWWEGLTACATTDIGGGDPLEAIMNAPLLRCDVAPWTLFGISLAGFNFLISLGGAVVSAMLLSRERAR